MDGDPFGTDAAHRLARERRPAGGGAAAPGLRDADDPPRPCLRAGREGQSRIQARRAGMCDRVAAPQLPGCSAAGSLRARNRISAGAYCCFSFGPARAARQCKGEKTMKTTTVLAIALGLGSLAACNKSPQQQAADNYEANVDNSADMMESNVDNAADQMTANADNASDAMKAAADNKSDAMKNAADNTADAMTNNSH